MKAKDYYEKYAERLLSPDTSITAVRELMVDFAIETQALLDSRKNKAGTLSDQACKAVLKEMNDKWNALANMFPVEVLKRNGWREYFMVLLSKANKGGEES